MTQIELLSIDLSNYCSKQCSFCYNHSTREGNTQWTPPEVIAFAKDCIDHGVKAISLGGGEPFEYKGIFEVIEALYPLCYLSVTSNGLPLEDESIWQQLEQCRPDKIHITIHHPDNAKEVAKVKSIVQKMALIGIRSGVNLLVGADKVDEAQQVLREISEVLSSGQIILVPQRYTNTPTPKQLSLVAGGKPFQCPSCLLGCKRPENFCSVSWDKKVNSCSFAPNKEPLTSLDYTGLLQALAKVRWSSC